MEVAVSKVGLADIIHLREMFLRENEMQFVCNKCHDYGWADTWLCTVDGAVAGYGSVWGTDRRQDRDTIFEFYLIEKYRNVAREIFAEFKKASGTNLLEAQSNDLLLTSMLYMFCNDIHAEAILFEDHHETSFSAPETVFRKKLASDLADGDDSEYILVWKDKIVAGGGLMLNYNFPYADVYMSVKENYRRMGFGSLIVQELKKLAYEMERVPAARCNINNQISQATLQKAGFRMCGFRLKGVLMK